MQKIANKRKSYVLGRIWRMLDPKPFYRIGSPIAQKSGIPSENTQYRQINKRQTTKSQLQKDFARYIKII